jgi:gluconokinase
VFFPAASGASRPMAGSKAPLVVVVMGVSGSGKTEVGRLVAAELGCEFLDADDFHPPENVERMRRGIPLDDEQRIPWLDRLAGIVTDAGAAGRRIVLACSALKRRYRERIGVGGPHVRLVHLDGPEELIRDRLARRVGHYMPASLLASQCAALERPTPEERAITVSIAGSPASIARNITAALAD